LFGGLLVLFLPPPLAVGFLPPFLSRFAGFISLVFSDLSACFWLVFWLFYFCHRLRRSIFAPFFVPLCGIYVFDF